MNNLVFCGKRGAFDRPFHFTAVFIFLKTCVKDHGDSSSRLHKKNTLVYFNKLANNFKPLDRFFWKIKILEIERRFRRSLSLEIIDILQGSKKGRLQFAIFLWEVSSVQVKAPHIIFKVLSTSSIFTWTAVTNNAFEISKTATCSCWCAREFETWREYPSIKRGFHL